MKKLNRINLHNLSQAELAKKEEKMLRGGGICVGICSCKYAGPQEGSDDSYYGGSSDLDNGSANTDINDHRN